MDSDVNGYRNIYNYLDRFKGLRKLEYRCPQLRTGVWLFKQYEDVSSVSTVNISSNPRQTWALFSKLSRNDDFHYSPCQNLIMQWYPTASYLVAFSS